MKHSLMNIVFDINKETQLVGYPCYEPFLPNRDKETAPRDKETSPRDKETAPRDKKTRDTERQHSKKGNIVRDGNQP